MSWHKPIMPVLGRLRRLVIEASLVHTHTYTEGDRERERERERERVGMRMILKFSLILIFF
jgi:hypothetical protein